MGRVLAALERYGGALLADPVGSGKTYIALAVARSLGSGTATCLVPAALVPQWQAVAERLGVPVTLSSHERASRGNLPKPARGLVVIDESHHFRNPSIRRYRHVAAWLGGRPGLLLTGTPVVNRLADVAHQLRLAVRDDALAPHGVPSLLALLDAGKSHTALGHLVLARSATAVPRPEAVRTAAQHLTGAQGDSALPALLEAIDSLELSRHPPIAALIRGVLWRAAASSPAALEAALRRYQRLLLDARDAMKAGHAPDRAALRRFTAGFEDQLVMWELISLATNGADAGSDVGAAGGDLHLPDLSPVEGVIAATQRAGGGIDRKVARLHHLLRDGRPTLVFTSARETVRYLRDRLGDPHLAWCTGDRAGIGHTALPRRSVLDWFRPGGPTATGSRGPSVLVTTDVAAEGLDLQRAARVVHYDLPWTPMRLEQREGRVVRAGSRHGAVQVIRFAPHPALEARLRQSTILAAKAALPARLGLNDAGRRLWRWRAEAAEWLAPGSAVEGVAAVPAAADEGALVGFVLRGQAGAGDAEQLDATLVWLDGQGGWTDDVDLLHVRLEAAARCDTTVRAAPVAVEEALARIAPLIRDRMRAAAGWRWSAVERSPAARLLVPRLQRFGHDAVRRRDAQELAAVERAVRFAAGGHTAGEAELVRRLAELDDRALRRALPALPRPAKEWRLVEAALTGIILFGSRWALLRCPHAQPDHDPLRSRRHADRLGAPDPR